MPAMVVTACLEWACRGTAQGDFEDEMMSRVFTLTHTGALPRAASGHCIVMTANRMCC